MDGVEKAQGYGDKGGDRVLREALRRFRVAADAEHDIRSEAREDLRFRVGRQWPEEIVQQRKTENRPCLTINRIPQFLRQVTNESRQNRPSVQVNPVDDQADPKTAEVFQGIIRHIEVVSNADAAKDTAAEHAATFGFGYVRVVTEYADDTTFDQEIRIKRVRNPFGIYFDPAAQEPDYSDAQFCFVTEDLAKEEFRRRYPKAKLASSEEFRGEGDEAAEWVSENHVRVAEYFRVEYETGKIALLADGSVIDADQVQVGMPVLRQRTVERRKVMWALISGCEVIEEREWPGRWIPVVPVLGEEVILDDERLLFGLVRFARDPQRQYNYWATAETEMIALAPKAPFIGAAGQFEGFERQWQTANQRGYAYLQYKPVSHAGTPLPPPQRQPYEPPVQAITTARMQSADDLKATTGIYDASLGARSNEASGRAILARQREADVSNFHFADNLARAVKHLGRILVDLIPRIYDTPRIVRIIGKEEEEKLVPVNQPFVENGVERIFDLTAGKYDVTVTTGPSYSTKRQEAVESMMSLTQAYPQLMQLAGDILVKSMDWPGAATIAERLKKTLPPNLAEDDNGEQMPVPPQIQQQMQAMQAQHEQLVAALQEATETIRSKKLELDSRERIAALQAQADLVKTEAQLASRENIELLRQELQQLRGMISYMAQPEPEPGAVISGGQMPPEMAGGVA